MTPAMKFKRPIFHFPHRDRGPSFFVFLIRMTGMVLLLAVAWVLTVLAMGIPSSWIREIEARLPESPFVAEAETVSYDLFRGVLLRDARIYRKGDVGRPMVAAGMVRLGIDPLAALMGRDWLRDVWISDGVIRRLEAVPTGKDAKVTDWGSWAFRLNVENTRIFGERVETGFADVLLDGGQIRLSRADGEIGEKEGPRARIQGRLLLDAAGRRYSANLNWSGQILAAEALLTELNKPGTLAFLRDFRPGPKAPNGDMELEGAFGEAWSLGLKLSGSARDCAFRGVDIRQIFLNMQVQAGAGQSPVLSFDPIVLIREDGLTAGGFSVDFATGDIRFDGYSTCHPGTLARLIAPSVETLLTEVRVEGPMRIHAGGTLNSRDFTRQSVTLFLEGQKIGVKAFLADRIACTARLSGTSWEIHDIAGECYGGGFTGAVDVVAGWTPEKKFDQLQFAVEGGVQNLDGQALAAAFGRKAPEKYAGRFDVAGRVSGVLGGEVPLSKLRGAGGVRFREGRLFRLPLFGPLSDFLARFIPGLDPEASLTNASAEWKLEEGVLASDSIVVGGDVVNLLGHGSYALTNSLAFDIQLKLMKTDTLFGKAVRTLTLPVSKLFEFRLKGSTDAPRWYPVNFSADVFDRISRSGRSSREKGLGAEKGAVGEGGPER